MMASSFKIDGLLGMFTIRLQEDNFAKWSFQFCFVLEGYDLFDHFDGTNVCPPKYLISLDGGVTKELTQAYKEWIKTDKALLSLLIAILGDEAIEYVVGSKTTFEAWTNLTDRYATVSRARINHLKTEFYTIKKGSDYIEKYLLRLKNLKDQLLSAGEVISDNDLIVVALAGLPSEYNIIRTVIVARETPLTLKEFRAQLLSAERTAEDLPSSLHYPIAGMYCQGESSNSGGYNGFHDHNTSNGRQFYHGESSNSGGQVSSHSTENYGFVGQYNISNPRGHSSGSFSQAHIPQQYKSHRPNSNNGGSNGSRYNSRSRFNGGFNTRHNGNNGFSSSSGSNSKWGSSWNNWNGNTGQKSHVIPECQICSKRGHTAPNCYYRNEQQPMVNQGIPECQICGKRGHVALNCFHRSNYAYQ